MNRKSRFFSCLCLFLALSLSLISFTSCKDENEEEKNTVNNGSEIEVADANYVSDLPDDLNYDGAVIRMVSRDSAGTTDEFYCEEPDLSDVVDSAVMKRNSRVEEMLDVVIECTLVPDGQDSHATISKRMDRENLAGTVSFDLVTGPMYTLIASALNGTFINLSSLEYLDLSKYYWSQGYNYYASAGSVQHTATGAATLSIYRYMYVTVCNEQVFAAKGLPSLYEVVKAGDWTLEYQTNLTKDLYVNLNSDPERDKGDAYGFVSGARTSLDTYWISCDAQVISKDDENFYTYIGSTDKLSSLVDRIFDLYYENEGAYIVSSGIDDTNNAEILSVFSAGNSAMASMMIMGIENGLQNVEWEFSIVPIPKYDKAQKDYHTHVQDQVTAFGICTALSADMKQTVGAVMEAMGAESYKYVYPAYFENVLPYRYLKTPESAELLQTIYEGCDFSLVFQCLATEYPWTTLLRTVVDSEYNSISNQMASLVDKIPISIEKVNNSYRDLIAKENQAS